VGEEFLKASEGLQTWIESQSPTSPPRVEKGVEPNGRGARSLFAKANDVHRLMETSNESGASLAEYNGFQDQARRFYDLGQELARAHYESRNDVLAHAIRLSLNFVSQSWIARMLFLFGTMLAILVYRN